MASNFDLNNFLPRHIRKHVFSTQNAPIPPFHSEESGWLNLDKNESFWGTIGTDRKYNLYPDAEAKKFREELAEYHQTSVNNIILGNGSDELLDLMMRAFCTPNKDSIVAFTPYESKVKHFAAINGIMVDEMPLNAYFQLTVLKVKSHNGEHNKLLYIANPNPISGQFLRGLDLIDVIEDFEGIVIVDESYIDFQPEHSLLPHIETYPNLVLLQSFSHVWGMAGLRLGVAFASPAIIEVLAKVKAPFNVNSFAQKVGLKALRVPEQKDRVLAELAIERKRVKSYLMELNFVEEVLDSELNFLLVRFKKSAQVLEYLKDEKIAVFDASHLPHCQGCLRISLGKEEQNRILIKALRDMPSKTSPTKVFLRTLGKTLQKASMFLGFFKKFIG